MGVNVVNLGDLVKIQTGKLDANASDENGLYPFFTCAVEPLSINTYAYDCECILIAGNGDLNVKYYKGKFNAYQRTYIIEVIDKNLDIRYLYHFLTKYIDVLRQNSIGGVIKYIKLGDLTGIKLPLPSLEEQKKIVSILDKADEIRRKKKQANDKLDEFLKSTFIDMFGDKDYEKRCLEDISMRKGEYGSGASAGEYDISLPRYVRITDINDNGKLTNTPVSPNNEPNIDKYTLTNGDILFARSGATVGKTYLYNERDGWCIYAGYCIRFKLNQDIVNPNYIFIYTQMNEYKAWVKSKQKVVAQPNINAQQYGQELLIPIPPIELQNKFAKIVEKVEAQKQKNEQVTEQMDNLFNALSQKAFKGEL